jgi:cytochrome c-type biogenesis protein CcmH/NrfG
MLLGAGRPEQALRVLFAALAQSPDDAVLLRLVGRSYLRLDDGRESARQALAALKQSLVLEADDPEGWSLLAFAYLRVGMLGDARVAARRAQELAPLNWSTHNTVAIVDAAAQYVNRETLAAVSEAVRLAPDEPEVHFAAARVAEARNRTREAVRHYREVLSLDPDHVAARNNLALLHVKRGETGLAAAGFVGILAGDPTAVRALNNLRYTVRRALRVINLLLWAAVGLVSITLNGPAPDSSAWNAIVSPLSVAVVAVAGLLVYLVRVRATAGAYFGRFIRSIARVDPWLATWALTLGAGVVTIVVAAILPLEVARGIYTVLAPVLFLSLVIFFTVSLVRKSPGER